MALVKVAEYPQKKCREGLFSEGGIGHNCELPSLHVGPCASLSSQVSVQRRDAWEAANPGWEQRSADGGDIIIP